MLKFVLNPLSAKFTKWSNTLKQFVGKLPTNCLSVFDHFMGVVLKGLILKAKFEDDSLVYKVLQNQRSPFWMRLIRNYIRGSLKVVADTLRFYFIRINFRKGLYFSLCINNCNIISDICQLLQDLNPRKELAFKKIKPIPNVLRKNIKKVPPPSFRIIVD